MPIKQQHADTNMLLERRETRKHVKTATRNDMCVFDNEGVTETKEVVLAQRNLNCELIVTSD